MTEFFFTEQMKETDLLGFKVKPGDTIYLSGFLDSPANSRFDLSRATWNGTGEDPVIISGHDAVITACNKKVSGGWRLVNNPTPHYVLNETANLMWMVENDNFISKASGTPKNNAEEWDSGENLWFDDNAGKIYYKPANGINANEQLLNWSSGRAAFKIVGKRHIHLKGINVSNCHTVGGNIMISGSTGITVTDTESYLGSISVFGGNDISLRRIKAHDHPLPIMMQNPHGSFSNITLENMHIYNCDKDGKIGSGEGDYQAISFRGNVNNLRLRNIHINSPVRDGISLYQHRMNHWDGVEVAYCYVHDAYDGLHNIHSGGILFGGDRAVGVMEPKDNIHVHHNVVHGCAGYGMRIKEYPASSSEAEMRVHDNYSFDNGASDQAMMADPPHADNYAGNAAKLIKSITDKTPS